MNLTLTYSENPELIEGVESIMKKNKIILAFSGGLDTSFCVLWLKKQGFEVVTLTVDTGGFTKKDLAQIKNQAEILNVSKHITKSAKREFYEQIVTYVIKGNLLRWGVYPLCAGPERMIIAKKLTEVAVCEKAEYVAHGSTGAGNDQVRFDVAIKTLAPALKIITPIRDLNITRNQEIEYLRKLKIPVNSISKSYSINKGLLGVTIGGKETKNSWESPPDEVYPGIRPVEKTPDMPEEIILNFQKGLPLNGIKIMKKLEDLGGKHGVGKGIHLGTTILGIKGRIAFAAPAITILIKAHAELEKLVLTKWQLFWKNQLSEVYGNFLHEALYYDPVMRDIEALINSSQDNVTGEVKVRLYKGNIVIVGVKSPYSLLDKKVAVYGEKNTLWNGRDAAGFTKIYGIQSILSAKSKHT